MTRQIYLLLITLTTLLVAFQGRPAFCVDAVTGFTGMIDSPYYRYEVRGQSSISLLLTQSLWEGGATQARIDMEKARLSSSLYTYQDAAASLTFDAIVAHADLVCQGNLVRLAKKNEADYAETIKMLQTRVTNGLATTGDVRLVESRLFRARGVLAEYTSQLKAAEANFQRITGRPVPASLVQVDMPKKSYPSMLAAIEASRTRNPRLLAQEGEIQAAKQGEKLAKADLFPKFGIQAGPRWHFQDTPQDQRNHGVEAMLTAQWNLYAGGATKATMRQSAAQTRLARQERQNVADTIESEIRSTWSQYEAARERMGYYRQSMEASMDARLIFYEQYMLGYKGLLDMLDADNEYFISACQHEIAQADRIVGAYRLLTLGGDILQTLNIKLPDLPPAPAASGKKSSKSKS